MEVKKIYFDMDGVLADFAGGVRELCGMEPVSQNAKNKDSSEEDRMWKAIKDAGHFYDKLEILPGASVQRKNIWQRASRIILQSLWKAWSWRKCS